MILIVAISLFACNKPNEMIKQDNLDTVFEFSVFNSQNEDLLDTATTNHYDKSEIKLFYEIDGTLKEVYDPTMDYPRNFIIYKHENEYRIRVFLNYTATSDRPITYIQWNKYDNDTIKAFYERNNNSVLKRKIWLNGIEIWNWTTNGNEYYKILK